MRGAGGRIRDQRDVDVGWSSAVGDDLDWSVEGDVHGRCVVRCRRASRQRSDGEVLKRLSCGRSGVDEQQAANAEDQRVRGDLARRRSDVDAAAGSVHLIADERVVGCVGCGSGGREGDARSNGSPIGKAIVVAVCTEKGIVGGEGLRAGSGKGIVLVNAGTLATGDADLRLHCGRIGDHRDVDVGRADRRFAFAEDIGIEDGLERRGGDDGTVKDLEFVEGTGELVGSKCICTDSQWQI